MPTTSITSSAYVSVFVNRTGLTVVMETKDETKCNKTKSLFLDFIYLKSKEKQLLEENDRLKAKIEVFEGRKDSGDYIDNLQYKKKRKRRTKHEVSRNFRCMVQNCVKAYG